MIQYEPKAAAKAKAENQREPIPVVFIPRKPHPNGLLLYQLATAVEHPIKSYKKLSFIVDTIPYATMQSVNATEAVKQFVNRYEFKVK